jgi:hypothetical protein
MEAWLSIITIGISVNAITNLVWVFILSDIRKRVHRLEEFEMKKSK